MVFLYGSQAASGPVRRQRDIDLLIFPSNLVHWRNAVNCTQYEGHYIDWSLVPPPQLLPQCADLAQWGGMPFQMRTGRIVLDIGNGLRDLKVRIDQDYYKQHVIAERHRRKAEAISLLKTQALMEHDSVPRSIHLLSAFYDCLRLQLDRLGFNTFSTTSFIYELTRLQCALQERELDVLIGVLIDTILDNSRSVHSQDHIIDMFLAGFHDFICDTPRVSEKHGLCSFRLRKFQHYLWDSSRCFLDRMFFIHQSVIDWFQDNAHTVAGFWRSAPLDSFTMLLEPKREEAIVKGIEMSLLLQRQLYGADCVRGD